jgi:DNA repair photolyase
MTLNKLKIIYEPKGPAREYAALALNLYNGCTHGCIYCYNNGRYTKPGKFFKASRPRKFDMKDLASDCRILLDVYGEAVPEVLISFIGDAYQRSESHLGRTRLAIRILINSGIPFTILTKSNTIRRDFDILTEHRSKFRLGMTILTTFEDEVQSWEPEAPSIRSRIDTLAAAKRVPSINRPGPKKRGDLSQVPPTHKSLILKGQTF